MQSPSRPAPVTAPLAAGRRRRRRRRCWPRADCRPGPGRWRSPPACASPRACRSPASPPGTPSMPRDQAHRRADDGEPLVRQPARDGAPPGPGPAVGRRADASGADGPCNFNRDANGNQVIADARDARRASSRASRARAGTPATSPGTTAATTASSGPAARSRCGSGTSATSRSRTRWSSTSRSASGTSARCSAQTFPNRRFLFSGTSSGTINDTHRSRPPPNGTIWDRLDAHNIDWGDLLPEPPSSRASSSCRAASRRRGRRTRVHTFGQFLSDVAAGQLPAVHVPRSELRRRPRRRTPRTSSSASGTSPRSCNALMNARPGSTPRCSSTTTSTAATTTTCPRRRRSRPTRSRRCSTPATSRAPSTATASGCR